MSRSFFDEVYQKLFKKQQPKQPVVHELLKRTEREQLEFNDWQLSEERRSILADLDRAYQLKQKQIDSKLQVHLLSSQYANGFAVSFNEVFTAKNFRHLFDELKEQVIKQGYKLVQGDRRIIDKETYEESIEKWYLKPLSADFEQEMIDQRYGNVIIECISINRKPSFLRLMANVYQDRLYRKAEPFDKLFYNLVTNV